MKFWRKISAAEQDAHITEALGKNINYNANICLGIPASKLDPKVFSEDAAFLRNTPLLRCYVQNPNHIGCHTLGESEPFFRGTQEIEQEVINLLSVDVFKAEENSSDGYIAAGGTEANIQAAWIYRNYFIKELGARHNEIAILCSVDTHYSLAKAADLLHIELYVVPVDSRSRAIKKDGLEQCIDTAIKDGIGYFIVIANMGTTMFGSVDDPELMASCLRQRNLPFRLHVDGAFGGFIYPVSSMESKLDFSNPDISSITLDAHKMLQAPYGTGIFLVRKSFMTYVNTIEASYVNGMDFTLSGSRSGTNAVAIWMILMTYGPFGWLEKINKLLYRTTWLCTQLDRLGVRHYRHPCMNIITIEASFTWPQLVQRFGLVPDSHAGEAKWFKIVVMDHVELNHLHSFIEELEQHAGR
jgi:tyrosine decarboxylase/aspartate 1-decarboxylase